MLYYFNFDKKYKQRYSIVAWNFYTELRCKYYNIVIYIYYLIPITRVYIVFKYVVNSDIHFVLNK